MNDATPARLRPDRALDGLTVTFRGMTARSDEAQCTCHGGSGDELALLKIPGVESDPDLLRRTWEAPDWSDHGAVLRRILRQFARELVAAGSSRCSACARSAGRSRADPGGSGPPNRARPWRSS